MLGENRRTSNVRISVFYLYILDIRHYAPNIFVTLPNFSNKPGLHLPLFVENRRERILTRNNKHGSHLRLSTTMMLKIVKTVLASLFSCTNITSFLRTGECIAKYHEHVNTHSHLSCSLFFITYSRRIIIKCKPSYRQTLANTVCESQFSRLLVNLCENARKC